MRATAIGGVGKPFGGCPCPEFVHPSFPTILLFLCCRLRISKSELKDDGPMKRHESTLVGPQATFFLVYVTPKTSCRRLVI